MNLAQDIAALPTLSVSQLRLRYAEIFGETTNAAHKGWLVKRIAWRIQALAEGNLSERARQRAAELANDADLRLSPPKPKPTEQPTTSTAGPDMATPSMPDQRLPPPGAIIKRLYKGQQLQVTVHVPPPFSSRTTSAT